MVIQKNGFYFIDDQYFTDFPDPFLKSNKGEKRPCYYCFSDNRTGLLWMIPLSSQSKKIQLAKSKIAEGKKDIFHLTCIGGSPGVMLVHDMFPITNKYILAAYEWNGIAVQYHDNKEIGEIESKGKKILALLRRGVRFTKTQPDVFTIEKALSL